MAGTSLAKLTRPRLFGTVARTRLFARLDSHRARPVVWIVGPPGAGKTVLAAGYLEARDIKGIWYHVDSGDSDPATFFYYLGEAVRKAAPRHKSAMPLLTPEFRADLGAFSRQYFRELFARLPDKSLLALDNYQEIAPDSSLHAALQEGLLELPDGVNAFVLSRTEPPPQLSRLTALDRVARVDWTELRLTFDETRQIATLRCPVDEDALGLLFDRSEGWVAGLTLMLERLSRSDARLETIDSDSKEAVFDFFAGEIFERSAADNQQMLMAAAFLPRPTAAAVESLSGHSGAGKLLDYLYRRHLFTDRRAGTPPVYQFHDLFRAFLLTKAHEIYSPAGVARLARRAATILEQSGQIEDALTLALDGEDWATATRLICSEASLLIAQGRGPALREWKGRIPQSVVDSAPWLDYWHGVSLITTEPSDASRMLMETADRFRETGHVMGDLLASGAVIQALYLEWSDCKRFDPWIDRLAALLASSPEFPSTDAELHVYSSVLIACFNRRPGDPLLEHAAGKVEAALHRDASPNHKVTASMALFFYFAASEQYDRGRPLVELLLPIVHSDSVTPLNRMMWFARTAIFLMFDEQLEMAARYVESAENIAKVGGKGFQSVVVHLPTASVGFRSMDEVSIASAVAAMQSVKSTLRPMDEFAIDYAQCMLAVTRGEIGLAAEFAECGSEKAARDGMFYSTAGMRVAAALAHAATGETDRASMLADQAAAEIAGTYFEWHRISLQFLEAYLHLTAGREDSCRAVLEATMSVATTRNTSHLRFAPPLASAVFTAAIGRGIHPDKARALIVALELRPPSPHADDWPWPVRIRMLGPFELDSAREDANTAKPPYKLLEFLKAIACIDPQGASVDTLKQILWPDSEGDAAERAFHTSLYRLRKLLVQENAVLHKDGRVWINPDVCWTDIAALAHLAESAGQLDDDAPLEPLADRCLALYRGDLLAQDREKPWMLAPRERARSQFRRALLHLGAALERRGQGDRAIELYRRGVERDVVSEEIYRRLMLCYRDRGDHAEALNVYRRCREMLSVVLGVEPADQTRAIRATL